MLLKSILLCLIILVLLCIDTDSYSLNNINSRNIGRLYRKHIKESKSIIRCTTDEKTKDAEPQLDDLVSKLSGPTTTTAVDSTDAIITTQPNPATYISCSACKTNYLMSESDLGKKGIRVRCSVCDKEWFQTTDRLMTTDKSSAIRNMTATSIADVKRVLSERNWPKYQRAEKFDVFVGNLPYTYEEKELGELFAEYGVTGISLVKDPNGMSKGFAFIEVSTKDEADKLVLEMHHFFTDSNRRLTVRLAAQPGQPREPREPRPGGGGGPGGGGPRGGGNFTPRSPGGGSGGGRSYTPRNK